MGDIIDNKIWIDAGTCLTMAESIDSFTDYSGKEVYHKKESDNAIIIQGLGRIHLPPIETYPLYFRGIMNDPHVMADYYICPKKEYMDAINRKIDECKKEIEYYEELLDTAK